MLDNQFAFESESISAGEYESGGATRPTALRCGSYERGEIQRSNTDAGYLPSDFFVGPAGYQVIADFPVASSRIKGSVRNDPNLRAWLNQLLQIAVQDPTAKIKIQGYTDCVNKENRNARLRAARADQVFRMIQSLVGRDPRWSSLRSRITVGSAPLDQYIVDNVTPVNRATNRAVSIELARSMSFEPEDVCDTRIKTVTVWVNAFIPRDIKGRTRAVPALLVRMDPKMAGKTMFDTNFGCGLTDQRSFSTDPAASSRMHSEAKIDLDSKRIVDQKHRIDRSVQLHCLTGLVLCDKRSPTTGMKFSWVGVSSNKELMFKVDGKQGPACPSNPLIKKGGQILLDAQIDYHGTFFIKRTVKNGKTLKNYVDIGFLGTVDMFPAYEFVVQLNNSNPIHIGGVLPKPGSSPVTHLGTSQKLHFVSRLALGCKNGKQSAQLTERIIN